MNVRRFETQEAWANWRLGKVTGSRAKKATSSRADASEVYRIAAESIIGSAVLAEEMLSASQVLDRGHRLEPLALTRFAHETGKKVNMSLVGWESDLDSRIAISPDASVGKTAAVEVKCLLSTKHVEALYTRQIPKNTGGYEEQMLHYFLVNPKLKTLYYVFYHPDFPDGLDFFFLTFTRKELEEKIAELEAAEREVVGKVREIVNALTLYSPEDVAKINEVKEELLATHEEGKARVLAKISRSSATV